MSCPPANFFQAFPQMLIQDTPYDGQGRALRLARLVDRDLRPVRLRRVGVGTPYFQPIRPEVLGEHARTQQGQDKASGFRVSTSTHSLDH